MSYYPTGQSSNYAPGVSIGAAPTNQDKKRKAGEKLTAIAEQAKHQTPMQRREGQGQGQGVLSNMENVLNKKGQPKEYFTPERDKIKMGKGDPNNAAEDFNPYTVDKLENFDLASSGDGSGRNVKKLSKSDLGNLEDQGHSIEHLEAYMNKIKSGEIEGKVGKGAWNRLQKMKDRAAANPGGTPPGDTDTGTPANPGEQPGNQDRNRPAPPRDGGAPPMTGGAGGTAGNTNNQEVTNTNRQTGGDVSVGGDNSGTIDNSVNNTTNTEINNNQRSYGGSSRTMNIYGGGGNGNAAAAADGAATAGTLGGMWAPDDSPAAQSKFVNFYADENKALQSQYADYGTDTANKWVTTAAQNNPIDYEALDQRISGRQLYHQDQATLQQNDLMGDMWKFTPSDYSMPKALESQDYSEKIGEATDDAYDRIDNM